MRRIVPILACIGSAAFLSAPARSATIHVPADYPTIYQALDAAVNGDVVEVAPGTYDQFDTRPVYAGDKVSSVGFLKDGVTLKSSGGAGVTALRLDSNTARPAILFGEEGEFDVEGFTFTGSLPELTAISIQPPDGKTGSLNLNGCVIRDYGISSPFSHEFAIDAYNTDVHIHDCSITNIDSPTAIAVFVIGGDLTVEDSVFKNCSGGALQMLDEVARVDLVVRRSSFENNGSATIEKGAISTQFAFTALVEDSWFYKNYAAILFGCQLNGGGAYLMSSLIIRNNTFVENSGLSFQEAICAFANSVELTGNTFYGGDSGATALDLIGLGGGPSLHLERNVASFSSGQPAVQAFAYPGFVVVESTCNVFWQNTGGNTAGFSLGATDLVADPQFCNAPAQDFTVNAASPCLPWNNNGCGQIGAWGLGCGDVSVEPSSWGQIKALYR